jgi:hypothetical protein
LIGWTKWDKIEIKGPKKIIEIRKFIKENYSVELIMIGIDKVVLYWDGMEKEKRLKYENELPEIVYELAHKEQFPNYKKTMELCCLGRLLDDEIDVSLPSIKYVRF